MLARVHFMLVALISIGIALFGGPSVAKSASPPPLQPMIRYYGLGPAAAVRMLQHAAQMSKGLEQLGKVTSAGQSFRASMLPQLPSGYAAFSVGDFTSRRFFFLVRQANSENFAIYPIGWQVVESLPWTSFPIAENIGYAAHLIQASLPRSYRRSDLPNGFEFNAAGMPTVEIIAIADVPGYVSYRLELLVFRPNATVLNISQPCIQWSGLSAKVRSEYRARDCRTTWAKT
jgi:hypothetical protein